MDEHNVYLSDKIIDESVTKLLDDVLNQNLAPNLYVIVVSQKEGELLEIYNSHEVNSDRFAKANHKIVGFGKGKKDTKDLVVYMIQDMLDNTGDISKESFLSIRN